MEGICKYCNQYKKLCRAHIIPKAFYNVRGNPYIGLLKNGNIDCQYSQNGLKDSNILCSECDALLGNYDKYAVEILKDQILKNPKVPPGYGEEQLYLMEKGSFDFDKLRKFFISLVWRASISKLCNVTLGKYEDIALKILKNDILDNDDLFHPIIIHRPKEYRFKDLAYITMQRLFNQKSILVAFPEYQISIITNISPIRNTPKFRRYFLNTMDLVVFETNKDVNKTQDLITFILNQIKNKHEGKLPDLHVK